MPDVEGPNASSCQASPDVFRRNHVARTGTTSVSLPEDGECPSGLPDGIGLFSEKELHSRSGTHTSFRGMTVIPESVEIVIGCFARDPRMRTICAFVEMI